VIFPTIFLPFTPPLPTLLIPLRPPFRFDDPFHFWETSHEGSCVASLRDSSNGCCGRPPDKRVRVEAQMRTILRAAGQVSRVTLPPPSFQIPTGPAQNFPKPSDCVRFRKVGHRIEPHHSLDTRGFWTILTRTEIEPGIVKSASFRYPSMPRDRLFGGKCDNLRPFRNRPVKDSGRLRLCARSGAHLPILLLCRTPAVNPTQT
jgi:hypothetical protein